jgi:hypothetical protein
VTTPRSQDSSARTQQPIRQSPDALLNLTVCLFALALPLTCNHHGWTQYMKDILFIIGLILTTLSFAFLFAFITTLGIFNDSEKLKKQKPTLFSALAILVLLTAFNFSHSYLIHFVIWAVFVVAAIYGTPDLVRLTQLNWRSESTLRITFYSFIGFSISASITLYVSSQL